MATIRDIAKGSNVSVATVSRVLNSPVSVNPKTRARVLATMRDFNYRPSPVFYGENSNASRTVGMYGLANVFTRHPYFVSLLEGVLSVTSEIDWSVTLLAQKDWNEPHRHLRADTDGRCEGLLLAGVPNDHPLIAALQERGMRFVLISGPINETQVNSVDIDNRKASFEATSYLIDLGHRRIAILPGDDSFLSATLRVYGYQMAMEKAGLASLGRIVPGTFREVSGYERTMAILEMPAEERPTALLCGSDGIALGVLRALKEGGVSVPSQMSVLGFDDIPLAAYTDPPLTTVHQPAYDIGKYAVQRLLELIHQPETAPIQRLFETHLVIRNSTAPRSNK